MGGLLQAAGGLALIIFGVKSLQAALELLFGDRLEVWISRVTKGRLYAAATGVAIATIAPSSTTMSLLNISMLQARRLTLRRACAIMLGTCVGMTVAIYVVALDLGEHAAALFVLGLPLSLAHRGSRASGLGHLVMAIGFIFIGIETLGRGTATLGAIGGGAALAPLADDPWLMLVLGAVASLLLQSSTATLALVIGLVVGNAVTLDHAIPMVLGANVGVSITTLLVGWRESAPRRLGLSLVIIRVIPAIGGVAVMTMVGLPDVAHAGPSWAIAAAHTAFNLVALLLGLAILGPVVSLTEMLVPDRSAAPDDEFVIDDRWVDEPTVAFAQTKREIGAIAARVSRMVDAFWIALQRQDEAACLDLEAHERELDKHYRFIKHFLARQMTAELTTDQAVVRLAHLRFVGDLESVADIIERNLVPVARKKIRRGLRFSEEGWEELAQFHEMVLENIELAAAAFMADDVDLANRLLRHKKKVRDVEIQLRVRHFERLRQGQRDTMETTELHLEILSHLKRINDLVSGVAYAVLEKRGLHAHGLQLIDEARKGQVTAPLEVQPTTRR